MGLSKSFTKKLAAIEERYMQTKAWQAIFSLNPGYQLRIALPLLSDDQSSSPLLDE